MSHDLGQKIVFMLASIKQRLTTTVLCTFAIHPSCLLARSTILPLDSGFHSKFS